MASDQDVRAQAAITAMQLDMAELAATIAQVREDLHRLRATLLCAQLDAAERDAGFPG